MSVDLVPPDIREAAEQVLGPTADWRLTSSDHSQVWRVRADGHAWAVKLLTDRSSDADVERWLLAQLTARHARPIRDIVALPDGNHLVLAPYLDGDLVADRLRRGPVAADEAVRLAGQYRHILDQIADLPPPEPGYGRLGSGHRAGHPQWTDALRAYLAEQCAKGPAAAALCHPRLAAALDRAATRLNTECGSPRLIATDVNARNFLITAIDGDLVALNLPVVWQGDPAMPYGILQLHLDDTAIAAVLADGPWPRWRIHFYAAYHAFVICVYVERLASVPLQQATPWGRHRPLLDLFTHHLRQMDEAW